MASARNPYKVWSGDRSKKKAVIAETLAELIEKGKQKLEIKDSTVTVVLEEDGTEVDDEEYFQCLQPNSLFLLLKEGESWHPQGYQAVDETDANITGAADSDTSRSLLQLAAILREDLARIITFSNNEMQLIVDSDTSEFKSLLGPKGSDAAHIQECCQRHLDDREKTMEAVQLLKMLDSKSGNTDLASPPKRKKIE